MKYEIKSNIIPLTNDVVLPTDKYKVNELEELFFDAVYEEIGEGIRLTRMSDGTLSVSYYSIPIGHIRLQGRKHKMQIPKGSYDVKCIEGNINDFIPHIKDWKKYIEKVIKEYDK